MPSFLEVVAVCGAVIVGCMLLFVAQSLVAPELVAGTLSEAIPQTCNLGKQWVIYDCLPNPITRIGCIVPGSGGKSITRKSIAVLNTSCAPQSNGDAPGTRVISFQWAQQGLAGPCISGPTGSTCCNYNGLCTSAVTFICQRTDQPPGGENQCTPQYLPVQNVPGYDSKNIPPSITQFVPCRVNFCGVPVPP